MRDRPLRRHHRQGLTVAVVYAAVATLWILVSDLLMGTGPDGTEWVSDFLLGIAFVLVTATALYFWVRRQGRRQEDSTERFRALAEQAPDLVYRIRLDPEPVFEYVSPASEGLTGYAPPEYYANPEGMLEAVHPDDRERLRDLLSQPRPGGRTVVLRWRHRDGRTIWTENRFTAVTDPNGDLVAIQGIARDITARREAEERNKLLATAVDAAGEAVMITDPDGRIEYVNPAFTEISGYVSDEVVGQTPRILNSGRQPRDFYDELWATIRSGRTFRGEMVNRRSDGRLYDQECTITPVLDSMGRVRHYVAVARDVTVQRELNERVRQAYKMQAVGQLAAGVAHDFRNLLNVIQINADLLLRGHGRGRGDTEEVSRLEDVRDAADRGARLVAKLLALGRRDDVQLVPTDLRSIVEGMSSTLRAVLPESITLTLEVPDSLPAVNADRGSMEQILLNLVTNARDAVGTGEGQVTVALKEVRRSPNDGDGGETELHPGRFVRISVQDSGAGIQPRDLRRIFEPFFSTKPEGKGTGLGLPAVRSLVERHAGFVSVQSQPGEGTTFDLFFPTSAEAAPATDDERVAAELLQNLPAGEERILLVEDENALRSAGARLLGRLGYDVITASDGAEALDWLSGAENPPALVVTDLVMPRMGGQTLFERSRERGWSVPFLFMSGYGSEELGGVNPDRQRAILEKPWTVEELARRVRDVLDEAALAHRRPASSASLEAGPP